MSRFAEHFLLVPSFLLLLLSQTPLPAQEVPSPADVLGDGPGERLPTVPGVSHDFSTLAEASDRLSVLPAP